EALVAAECVELAERTLHLGELLDERAALLGRDLGLDQRRPADLSEPVDLNDRRHDRGDQRRLHDGEAEKDQPDDRTRAIQRRSLDTQTAAFCAGRAKAATARKKIRREAGRRASRR